MARNTKLAFLIGAASCAQSLAVPNVVGLPLSEARDILLGLGFLVTYRQDRSPSHPALAGKVATQSLPPGKRVAASALIEMRAYASASPARKFQHSARNS